MIIIVIISRVIKTLTSVFSFSVSDKWPNPLQSVQRAEARGEDPMGLVVDMFEGKIPEEIDTVT